MPGYSDALSLIEGTIAANWSNTQVAYENVVAVDYSDPNRPALSDGQAPYIQTKVKFTESMAAAVGVNSPKRTWGYLEVYFHSRTKEGTKPNQINVDAMLNIFEYMQIDYITFKENTTIRSYTEEGWYITPIMIRFYFNR